MPSYLVETYLSNGKVGERVTRERRARLAAEELSREQTRIQFERSIHIPQDETCFFVFTADSGADVARVAQRAQLEPIRVVEVAPTEKGEEK